MSNSQSVCRDIEVVGMTGKWLKNGSQQANAAELRASYVRIRTKSARLKSARG